VLFAVVVALASFGCSDLNSQVQEPKEPSQQFKDYWYAGEAELTRYKLEQARYGEIHEGDAVLIFVTEDFRTDKQVKYEGGERKNVASVLKLNATRKFFTGIYPYSMMSSIFTPVDPSASTYKVTTSSQEWCGHTFSQLNLQRNQYKGKLFSYFQDEGDQEFSLNNALLEDEIWNKIRLNPESLPTGSIELIPGTMFLRLSHLDFKVQKATASMQEVQDTTLSDRPLMKYRVEYQDVPRVLEITFESNFPYQIVAWEEEGRSGFGQNAKTLTTRAVRTHTMKSAYWGQHDVADAPLRAELGLDPANY